eukprot:3130916-Rhodomonas_salina.2
MKRVSQPRARSDSGKHPAPRKAETVERDRWKGDGARGQGVRGDVVEVNLPSVDGPGRRNVMDPGLVQDLRFLGSVCLLCQQDAGAQANSGILSAYVNSLGNQSHSALLQQLQFSLNKVQDVKS